MSPANGYDMRKTNRNFARSVFFALQYYPDLLLQLSLTGYAAGSPQPCDSIWPQQISLRHPRTGLHGWCPDSVPGCCPMAVVLWNYDMQHLNNRYVASLPLWQNTPVADDQLCVCFLQSSKTWVINPATLSGEKQAFVYDGESLQEINWFKPQFASWLVGNSVISGKLFCQAWSQTRYKMLSRGVISCLYSCSQTCCMQCMTSLGHDWHMVHFCQPDETASRAQLDVAIRPNCDWGRDLPVLDADGGLYLFSRVDPLLLALPYLEESRKKVSPRSNLRDVVTACSPICPLCLRHQKDSIICQDMVGQIMGLMNVCWVVWPTKSFRARFWEGWGEPCNRVYNFYIHQYEGDGVGGLIRSPALILLGIAE